MTRCAPLKMLRATYQAVIGFRQNQFRGKSRQAPLHDTAPTTTKALSAAKVNVMTALPTKAPADAMCKPAGANGQALIIVSGKAEPPTSLVPLRPGGTRCVTELGSGRPLPKSQSSTCSFGQFHRFSQTLRCQSDGAEKLLLLPKPAFLIPEIRQPCPRFDVHSKPLD